MDLEQLQEKYDELADPVETIQMLIKETHRKDLKEDLLNLIMYYEDELKEMEEQIEELQKEEYKRELEERELEFGKLRL